MNQPVDQADRTRRHAALLRLVANGAYRTQEELVLALVAEGVAATQASVCRDVQELGLSKEGGVWRMPAVPDSVLGEGPWKAIVSAAAAGPHLVVVRVTVGSAQSVARALDSARMDGVVGTVAGVDTFLVATVGRRTTRRIADLLNVVAHR